MLVVFGARWNMGLCEQAQVDTDFGLLAPNILSCTRRHACAVSDTQKIDLKTCGQLSGIVMFTPESPQCVLKPTKKLDC